MDFTHELVIEGIAKYRRSMQVFNRIVSVTGSADRDYA